MTYRYEAWRQRELRQIRPLRKIARWVFTTCLVLGVTAGVIAGASRVDIKEAATSATKRLLPPPVRCCRL